MSNWCNNEIDISADDNKIALVKELIFNANKEVDFNRLLPIPDSVASPTSDEDPWIIASIVSKWGLLNWGTRSNACDTKPLDNGKVWFATANSPPGQWFISLCKQLEREGVPCTLRLSWGEPGVGVGGEYYFESGQEITESIFTNKELHQFFGGSDDPYDDIIDDIIRLAGVNYPTADVLNVAVGHLHDLLYTEHSDSYTFTDSNGDPITLLNLTEPDGVRISLYGNETFLQPDSLTGNIKDEILSLKLTQQVELTPFVDLVVKLTVMLEEAGIDIADANGYG